MPKMVVTARDGVERTIAGRVGLSVMEVIRDEGFGELMALCGGCCSCATCHVYIGAEWLGGMPPASEDEKDLLGGSEYRSVRSRLSCQIPFNEALDGLRVEIAPED